MSTAARSLLLVGNFVSSSSGVRGVCEELAPRLRAQGWSVVTTSERAARLPRLSDMLGTTWRERGRYRVAHVDVFSGPAFFWAEAVCWLLRSLRKPYVLTLHGGGLPAFAARHPVRVRRTLRHAVAVTAPSPYLSGAMQQYLDDVIVIPNAIELSRYPFRLRGPCRPSVVWLRAFHRIYDPCAAVRAAALLAAEMPDVMFSLFGPDKGDGSSADAMALVRNLGMAHHVQFRGPVEKPQVPAAIDCGDVFLNTSLVDNTPVTVLEAMACGACVVSTNAGGIPQLAAHEADALLVPCGDAAAMAAAVRRVLSCEGLARRLSAGARRRAEAWDWPAVLALWDRLFTRFI